MCKVNSHLSDINIILQLPIMLGEHQQWHTDKNNCNPAKDKENKQQCSSHPVCMSSLGISYIPIMPLCGCLHAHIAQGWIIMRQCLFSALPSLSLSARHWHSHTHTSPNPRTDTESQWYYSWNACYVFSTNERMKKNKQRGQIKREKKKDWEKKTHRGRRGNTVEGETSVCHSICILLLVLHDECFWVRHWNLGIFSFPDRLR